MHDCTGLKALISSDSEKKEKDDVYDIPIFFKVQLS